MSLDGALSIATGGLANVNRRMALVSQNVANASTPGYAAEIATQRSLTADGVGLGVHSGPAIRNLDTMLQAEVFSQNATVAGLHTRQTALAAIDAAQGTPGQGTDIASLLGKLQDQFSTLLNDPASAPQQSQVVWAATTLTQGINAVSDAYVTQRQTAEDNIGTEIATLNTTLGTIGGLSNKIVTLKAGGQSTADLENQRDAAMADLSQLLDVKALEQPNGDLMVVTSAGLVLPIHGATNPFATVGVNVQPGTFYPGGGINGITLGGTDVTSQLRGGQIGANIALRDTTLPTDQAELDEFAQNLAYRFSAMGLTLFTDPSTDPATTGNQPGTILPSDPNRTPPNGYVGFAATIQVNSAGTGHAFQGARWGLAACGPARWQRCDHPGRADLYVRCRANAWQPVASVEYPRPRPQRHIERALFGASDARRHRLCHARVTGAGERHDQHTGRHRAGGADHARKQAVGTERREHGYRDVEHDPVAERLWRERQGHRRRAGDVGPAPAIGGMRSTP